MPPRPCPLQIVLRVLLLAAGACGLGCGEREAGSGGAGSSRDPRSPRAVVLVTLDTTRADRLGCYGYPLDTTPELDRLAAEGVRFEHALSTSGATPMAHASILTGLEPYQHGVRVISGAGGHRLSSEIPTLASFLATQGWRTVAFLSSFTVSSYYGLDHGFELFDSGLREDPERALRDVRGMQRWNVARNQRRADRTAARFLDWLQEAETPFFAWLHLWDPHDDHLLPPRDVLTRFVDPGAPPAVQRSQRYDAELFFVDQQLGRIRRGLEARGLWERTAVVVIADHGEGLGDHGWQQHRRLYQEQIRVPLIIAGPGIPKGAVVDALVRNVDVLPTVAEWLGRELPAAVAGRSLMSLWKAGEQAEPAARLAYAEQLNEWDTNAGAAHLAPRDRLMYSLQDREWKLIYRARVPDRSELFHVAEDPAELRNLYSSEHPQARRLKAALDALDAYRWEPFEGDAPSEETLERLRSLGYVEEAP